MRRDRNRPRRAWCDIANSGRLLGGRARRRHLPRRVDSVAVRAADHQAFRAIRITSIPSACSIPARSSIRPCGAPSRPRAAAPSAARRAVGAVRPPRAAAVVPPARAPRRRRRHAPADRRQRGTTSSPPRLTDAGRRAGPPRRRTTPSTGGWGAFAPPRLAPIRCGDAPDWGARRLDPPRSKSAANGTVWSSAHPAGYVASGDHVVGGPLRLRTSPTGTGRGGSCAFRRIGEPTEFRDRATQSAPGRQGLLPMFVRLGRHRRRRRTTSRLARQFERRGRRVQRPASRPDPAAEPQRQGAGAAAAPVTPRSCASPRETRSFPVRIRAARSAQCVTYR